MINEVTVYTKDDFLNSTTPFETLYRFIGDKFTLSRELEKMSDIARAAGVRNFKALFKNYCDAQRKNSAPDYAENVTNFDNQPIELNSGRWQADEYGIRTDGAFGELVACCHPLVPVRRLVNIDTGIEKLELAFRKGRGWRRIICDKKQLASASSIVGMADYGVAVTSENAKYLVTYLHDIENINYEIIPESRSVSRLGWIEGEGFSPYVDGLIFDGDASFKHFFESVKSHGSRDEWFTLAKKIRKEKGLARIMLAASFASVLVGKCGGLPFMVHLWGGTETGKPQPLSTRIITPTGETTMRQISIGDDVIGCDGMPHKVTGVYPKGNLEIYELTFKDGTTTRCSKDHLWSVKTLTRKEHGRGFKVMTLEEMMALPLKKDGYNLRIPITAPVQYAPNDELPISPYLLGSLLGDGCLTLKVNPANGNKNIYFNNSEDDVVGMVGAELNKIGLELRAGKGTGNQHVLSGAGKKALMNAVMDLKLNVLGENKFIPRCYKFASVEERRELLAGLMDTDGHVTSCGSFTYSTGSKQLADDIAELCRSLGYRTTTKLQDRTGQEYHSANKTYCRISPEYIVRILTHEKIFKSMKHMERSRKAEEKHRKAYTHQYDDLPIVSIEPCGAEECQCIMIDSEAHTYLCDDFIVTHNTVGLLLAASVWANPEMGKYIHTFNSTAVAQELSAGFVNSLPLCLDELQIIKERKDFDNMIYQLCEGVGRSRGQKTGGLQKTTTWENCILTTGEQPISGNSSGGGAVNRVIEINCEDVRLFDDPVGVAEIVKRNYGFAGREFVEKLQDPKVMEQAILCQKKIYKEIVSGDTTEKQAISASLIMTADIMSGLLLFGSADSISYDDITKHLSTKDEVSSSERAYSFLIDWIASNQSHFDRKAQEVYGEIDDLNKLVYIIRNVFNKAMSENGYNPTSFLHWLKRKDYIITSNGFTRPKRIGSAVAHCVCLKAANDDMPTGFEEMNDAEPY